MKKFVPYVGALGLGFLLAGGLLWVMQRASQRYWGAFLVIGLVLTALYAAGSWNEIGAIVRKRSAKEGANAFVLALIVVGILVLVNVLADRRAEQWDFTATQQYSLSEQTTKIVGELDRDVEFVLFDRRGTQSQIERASLLEQYGDESPRVNVTIIDPEVEPQRALPYQSPTEPGMATGTILVAAGERQQRVTASTEPEITNALIRVLKEGTKKVYFTEGHEERDLADGDVEGLTFIQGRLESSAYEIEPLLISRTGEGETLRVPDDAAAVVIAGPKTDFLPNELDALDEYVGRGGSALFLLDPEMEATTPELDAFVYELGITVGKDIVVDIYANPAIWPVVSSYSSHPIVGSFGGAQSIFGVARSVTMADNAANAANTRELFATEEQGSWAETRIDELSERNGPADDQELGPIGLAMATSIETEGEATREARIVVVGDSNFITNQFASAPILNADLFLNMVNWVAEDEDLISIRPREPEDRRIALSAQAKNNVFFLSLLIIPGIVVVTGVSVWLGRR